MVDRGVAMPSDLDYLLGAWDSRRVWRRHERGLISVGTVGNGLIW